MRKAANRFAAFFYPTPVHGIGIFREKDLAHCWQYFLSRFYG